MYIKVPIKNKDTDLDIQLKIKLALEEFAQNEGVEEGEKWDIKIRTFKKHIGIRRYDKK